VKPPRRGLSPALALALLAPVTGELVSGHAAPLEFFNPIVWLLMAAPYGLGALVCRELAVRWGGGWWRLLALAAAYGLFEEGIVARSLFDPNWSELGAIGDYAYAGGVNWTYAEMLVHFHVTISILSAIAIAEALFPAHRGAPWLGRRGLAWSAVGLAAWAPALLLVQALADDPEWPVYVPAPAYLIATALAIVALGLAARRSTRRPPRPSTSVSVARPAVFFVIGLVDTTLVFIGTFAVPEWEHPPPLLVSIAALALIDAVALAAVWRLSGRLRAWETRHVVALASGHLTFFLVFDVLSDVTDGFEGKSIVGVAGGVALVWLARAVRASAASPSPTP
jgi:hypothetical protein